MIFSIIAMIASTSPIQNASSGPVPAGNPGNWINRIDYPQEALRNRVEGTTSFALTIGMDGLVQSCEVTTSSGSAALDYTTCNKITERARFRPARDEAGKAIIGNWSSRIRWQMPTQQTSTQRPGLILPNEFSTTSKITLMREKDGTISSCKYGHFVTEEQEKALCDQAKWRFGKNLPDSLIKDRVKIVVSTTTKIETSLAEAIE
ncbi:TonB family protein [Sphingorhabdus sp. Alg231-15]|uniref:TonB family protein n=1 Tax=Sphingorhabdus sp. Alg231-15 TaxID=1922222 RepID=UPI000D55D9A4